jgi:hypothetical protein
MPIRRMMPSPLLAVGVGALVVGLSVPAAASEATHLINGKSIAKHTITGAKLKNNTLTGRQINESRLGIVPRAKSASVAGEASKLDGIEAAALQAKLKVTVVTAAIDNLGGEAICPSGYRVVGGGFDLPLVDPTKRDFVRTSRPEADVFTQAWLVVLDPAAINDFQVNAGSTAYAICVE